MWSVECVISIFSMGVEMWTNVKKNYNLFIAGKESHFKSVEVISMRALHFFLTASSSFVFFVILAVKYGEKLVI